MATEAEDIAAAFWAQFEADAAEEAAKAAEEKR